MPLNNACAETKNRHHTRWNHRRRTPAMLAHQPALAPPHPLKPPHLPPASHHRAPRSHSHCAHAQGQSRVRACRVCRARRIGDANRNAAQTGGLARQVRQRMNRLGKPEHRARFCFFSKKKSLAGTRRFPIPSKIQIRMGFKRSATSLAALKLFLISPTCGRCLRHRAPQAAAFARSASARPLEPTPLRACAGPEPGSSMPHGVRRACRAAARGMQAETPPK